MLIISQLINRHLCLLIKIRQILAITDLGSVNLLITLNHRRPYPLFSFLEREYKTSVSVGVLDHPGTVVLVGVDASEEFSFEDRSVGEQVDDFEVQGGDGYGEILGFGVEGKGNCYGDVAGLLAPGVAVGLASVEGRDELGKVPDFGLLSWLLLGLFV